MFTKIAILVGVIAVTVAARDPGSIHPTYDCTGKPELNDHPTDCTRYIQCDNGRAWDKPCAACDQNNVAGCQGEEYTHFQRSVNDTTCVWPKDSTCKGSPITPEPGTTTATDRPTPTTVSPGLSCDADNCTVNGDCFGYQYCKRNSSDPADNTGTVTHETCPPGQYFDERKSSVVASCVSWDELDPATQEEYLRVDGCTYCEIIPLGHCLPTYRYRNEHGVISIESCKPAGHVYDDVNRRCVRPDLCK